MRKANVATASDIHEASEIVLRGVRRILENEALSPDEKVDEMRALITAAVSFQMCGGAS